MNRIGLWKTARGFVSHASGLTEDQVQVLKNLRVGDRIVIFLNDVREGEKGADATLMRSNLPVKPEEKSDAVQA